ncbi:F-box/LRR-repeat protein [Camellia lanceoleosa]|uniref:F-box/LRR-repeat protein n=1 Tax=Camellia lanceoleosa TaxID=1840588 RepID=A0ACC0GT46_9ERIC|nr:F-box/LRR-repeat protein [Camellia lanceoleosa]
MEGGKWEDLNMDCLLNVFGRVGIESLLLDIPFVCKSWHRATLSPPCWKQLDFSRISLDDVEFPSRLMDVYEFNDKLAVNAFIKFVIKCSAGSVTFLSIPDCCTEEAFLDVANECPDLRVLLLPLTPDHDYRHCYQPYDYLLNIPSLMSKWKNLEFLRLGGSFQMEEVLAQTNIHCKNFIALDITKADIGDFEASVIVTLLPNIKLLYPRNATMEKEHLVMILKGYKGLEYVDVSKCIGFDAYDDEILKLASQIPTFINEGSMFDYYDVYIPP